MPNRSEWEVLKQQYKQACEKFLSDPDSDDDVQIISGDDEKSQTVDQPIIVESNVGGVSVEATENSSSDKNGVQQIAEDETLSTLPAVADDELMKAEASQEVERGGVDESAMPIVIVANSHKFIFCLDHKIFTLYSFPTS
jgi:hypothetical protein